MCSEDRRRTRPPANLLARLAFCRYPHDTMTRYGLASLLLAGTMACAPTRTTPTAPVPTPPSRSRAMPTADELRRDLTVFSADSFRGREAGTADERRAARFLADRLAALGVEPAGDSGFYQRVPLISRRLTEATRFTIVAPSGQTVVTPGEQLVPLTSFGPGAPLPRTTADGDLVFAGYGLTRADLGRNDFAGLNAQGKVVVVVISAPAGVDDATRNSLESESAIGDRLFRLASLRPAAIIFLLTGKAGQNLALGLPDMLRSMSQRTDAMDQSDSLRTLPMVLLGRLELNRALLPAGWPNDDRAQLLTGRRFSGRVEQRVQEITSYNIVGIVRGIDPALRGSYVAYGAHYDHLGILPAENGDSIANGADDDGSGSMALLAIARTFTVSTPRPRRSILFVWHTAEEKGLLGSEYFSTHSTVPMASIVGQINADMIGRNGGDTVFVVGPSAAPNGQGRRIGAMLDSVNAAMARPLVFDRTWDDPEHPERIYERSDHYSYARQGVPIVFLTGPLHADYHRVSDDASRVNYESLARITSLLYEAGLAMANATRPPR